MIVLVIFLIAITKYLTETAKERKVCFLLWFEGAIQQSRKDVIAETGGSWSCSILLGSRVGRMLGLKSGFSLYVFKVKQRHILCRQAIFKHFRDLQNTTFKMFK